MLVFCLGLTARTNAQRIADSKSAQGSLTVTATVVSSVGIVIGPNGEQVLVVANAPAGDNKLVFTPVWTPPPDPSQPTHEQHEQEKRVQK